MRRKGSIDKRGDKVGVIGDKEEDMGYKSNYRKKVEKRGRIDWILNWGLEIEFKELINESRERISSLFA